MLVKGTGIVQEATAMYVFTTMLYKYLSKVSYYLPSSKLLQGNLQCGFFKWCDDPFPVEARVLITDQRVEIENLKAQIIALGGEP